MINGVFTALKAFYGQKFSAVFVTEDDVRAAKRLWAKDLIALRPDQIKQALEACKTNTELKCWPPTIGQFLEAANKKKTAPEHRLFVPQLTQKSDPGIASENLAKIREMLKITNKS